MRRLSFALLCLLGVAEIAVGAVFGRLMIYCHEIPFARAIGLTPDRYRPFNQYIRLLKDQWSAVAWFGVLTIILALMFLYSSNPRKTAKDAEHVVGGKGG
ncbi:MAG: hypothetical protein V4584_09015 [Verrucomicrobiota bacterium]